MASDDEQRGLPARLGRSVLSGLSTSLGTIWFLLKIILPITLAMALLSWSGVLEGIARFLSPLMGLIGLPGTGALVFLSSMLLNIYSAIAVAGSIALSMREGTILAIMCLSAHSLFVETAVMRKTGSSALKMVLLRIGVALVAAALFNLILPASFGTELLSASAAPARQAFLPMLGAWALSTGRLVLKIVIIVVLITLTQRLLEEFGIMSFLSRLLAPLMKVFGLPAEASFLWLVINIVGYSYGAGIIKERIDSGKMKPQDGDLFNHHAAVCHSLLEDTALYAAVGIPLFWLTVPRLILASAVGWIERIRRHYFRRSFRAGVV